MDKLEPGDIILQKTDDRVKEGLLGRLRYLLNDSFMHIIIVMEHEGKKCAYHSYKNAIYEEGRQHIPSHDKYVLGSHMGWTTMLEPLELYLYEDSVRNQCNLQIIKGKERLTYNPDVHKKILESKGIDSITHCNVTVGIYLAEMGIIKKNPFTYMNPIFYNPSSIYNQQLEKNCSVFYAQVV